MSNTRERILDAASGLVEARLEAVPSMSTVARATGGEGRWLVRFGYLAAGGREVLVVL